MLARAVLLRGPPSAWAASAAPRAEPEVDAAAVFAAAATVAEAVHRHLRFVSCSGGVDECAVGGELVAVGERGEDIRIDTYCCVEPFFRHPLQSLTRRATCCVDGLPHRCRCRCRRARALPRINPLLPRPAVGVDARVAAATATGACAAPPVGGRGWRPRLTAHHERQAATLVGRWEGTRYDARVGPTTVQRPSSHPCLHPKTREREQKG